MTPRVDAAARALDTEQTKDIYTNPDGANAIRISEEEFAVGKPSKKKPENSAEEFYRRTIPGGKLDVGRTVRSGFAYDFDSTDPVRLPMRSGLRGSRRSSRGSSFTA